MALPQQRHVDRAAAALLRCLDIPMCVLRLLWLGATGRRGTDKHLHDSERLRLLIRPLGAVDTR